MLALFFVTPDSPNSHVIGISIIIGLGLAGGGMIPWAILPFIQCVRKKQPTLPKNCQLFLTGRA